MKKTISINLNQQIFYLDTDAYDELEKYLGSIKKYFQDQDSLEVVDDIEARIAEKFNEIINKSKKAIQITDVAKIIKEMGTVDDITEEASEGENETEKIKKKLFRDSETKILAGVITGISQYFGIKKPIWLRLIFLILLLNPKTFWLAIIGYITAWLIIPEAKTGWEKLEMKGKPTTVSELQLINQEKTSNVIFTIETFARNFVQKLFSIFGHLIRFFGILFCRLIGFFGLIFTVLTIMAIVIGMIFVYLYPNLPYFDFSFLQNISAPWLEIAYITLGLTIITPFVFIIDLFDSLMRLKWHISTQKIIVLLAVWVSALIISCSIAKINYSKYKDNLNNSIEQLKDIHYIDENNSEILSTGEISDIDISSVKEVKITESNENEVNIIGSKYALAELSKNYEKGKLTIVGKSKKYFDTFTSNSYISSVRVEIKTKKLSYLKLDNNIDAWYYPLGNNNVNIDVASKVGLKIEGNLNKATLKVSQNSVVNMLDSKTTEIDATLNSSVVKTQARKIKITGDKNSTLIYKGTPEIISGNQDKSNQKKYILSEDTYDKLSQAIKDTSITINNTKKKITDLNWSEDFIRQKDDNFYNIYTTLKLKENDNKVYVLWLTEKDGVITLKNSLKIDNWEEAQHIDLVNEKLLEVTGQIYGPDMEQESKEIYIDKIKGILQIKI